MFNTFKAALPAYAGQRSSSGNVCGNAIFFKTSAFELVSRMVQAHTRSSIILHLRCSIRPLAPHTHTHCPLCTAQVHNLYGKDVLRAINPEPEPDTEHWFGTLHHTALHLTLRVKGANSGDASKGAAAAAAATTDAAAASSATAAPPAPAVATGAGGGAGAEDGGSSGGSSNSGSSSKIRSDMLHVVCTHFYWRPQDSHMKSYQAAALTHHVGAHVAKGEHLLVCGDLNSMPKPQLELHDDNGWVLNSAYDIITKGKPVAPAGASPEALSAFGVAPVLKLRSPWPSGWQSAYASVNGAEPKYGHRPVPHIDIAQAAHQLTMAPPSCVEPQPDSPTTPQTSRPPWTTSSTTPPPLQRTASPSSLMRLRWRQRRRCHPPSSPLTTSTLLPSSSC